jgi:hypothetical protein
MIKIQFKDGKTISFDLETGRDLGAWDRFSKGDGWKNSVTALAILRRKTLHTLPAPNHGLKPSDFGAGLIIDQNGRQLGEKVWYLLNGMEVALVVYNGQKKVTKVTLTKSQESDNGPPCLP